MFLSISFLLIEEDIIGSNAPLDLINLFSAFFKIISHCLTMGDWT